jgi:hypothetical protein
MTIPESAAEAGIAAFFFHTAFLSVEIAQLTVFRDIPPQYPEIKHPLKISDTISEMECRKHE